MKRFGWTIAAGAALAFGVGMTAWRVSAQEPAKEEVGKAANSPDPLVGWAYPNAKWQGEANGERLKEIPLHGVQFKTTDSLEKTYFFYMKKSQPTFVATPHTWNKELQPAFLMTQFDDRGTHSANTMHIPRKDADSAMLVVRQAKRTITVQLSRDPNDRTSTDVLLIADEH